MSSGSEAFSVKDRLKLKVYHNSSYCEKLTLNKPDQLDQIRANPLK